LGTFTIITGDSSGVSADIHDRMQVWLQAGQIHEWMAASTDDAMAMLLASEPPAMEAYRVSRPVNTPEQQHRAAAAARRLSGCRKASTRPSRRAA